MPDSTIEIPLLANGHSALFGFEVGRGTGAMIGFVNYGDNIREFPDQDRFHPLA
jgi:hypothetical protein